MALLRKLQGTESTTETILDRKVKRWKDPFSGSFSGDRETW